MLEIELGSSEEELVLLNTEIFSLPHFFKNQEATNSSSWCFLKSVDES